MLSLVVLAVSLGVQLLVTTACTWAGAAFSTGGAPGRLRRALGVSAVALGALLAIRWAATAVLQHVAGEGLDALSRGEAASARDMLVIGAGLGVTLVLGLAVATIAVGRAYGWGVSRTLMPLAGVTLGMTLSVMGSGALTPRATEAFRVPTNDGMVPTIHAGDQVMVFKLGVTGRVRRFDLVAFRSPGQINEVFLQRVLALPGERLRFEREGVFVDNRPLAVPHPYRAGSAVPGGRASMVAEGQTITLGPDEFFLVGDNTDYSLDSRHFGAVEADDLVGIADLRYAPASRISLLR